MVRLAICLAAAAVALVSVGCNLTLAGPLKEEKRSQTAAHVATSPIQVQTENGAISVVAKADAKEVTIHAVVRATTDERLAQTKVTAERLPDGTLRVGVAWPNGKPEGNEQCSFEITVPDAKGVKIKTSNGGIRVDGLAGDAALETSNGAIKAEHQAGAVKASTSNGKIEIAAPAGAVEAKLSNGTITITDAPAGVTATGSNGGITVRLTPTSPGPVLIDTSNGAVTLDIGPAFVGELDLRTSNGKIKAQDLPGATVVSKSDSSTKLKFGDKGTASRIKTSNGGIEVRPAK